MNHNTRLFAALFCALSGGVAVAAPAQSTAPTAINPLDPHANESHAARDRRMKWWREARFGMFIHWGLYAVPAGNWQGKPVNGLGEWIMNFAKIPVNDYAALAPRFNPTQFNAQTWVALAKASGMKYIVITAKHHDGFAMFHSASDAFNIYDATPFKRDPIAELAQACKRADIKFGVYYSQAQDWHHAGGGAYGQHWDSAQTGDLHAYVRDVAAPQVRELLTRYRPAILWWDTPVQMSPDDVRALTGAFPLVPDLIANNRLGNGVAGDTETPEQFVPARGFSGHDWETCMTINDTWGFKRDDQNFKSSDALLRNLIDIASKGGNYLLNVGPDAQGVIPQPEVERLRAIGAWLRRNGASIYGTSASPFKRLPFDGRATLKGSTLYLHVFAWPAPGLTLAKLRTGVKSARVFQSGENLRVSRDADGILHIAKPSTLDNVVTTIELRLSGAPQVEVENALPQPDGSYALSAMDADLEGEALKLEGGRESNLGFWTRLEDAASWTLQVPVAGARRFRATAEFSCAPNSEGSHVALQLDGKDVGATAIVPPTTNWNDYQTLAFDGDLTMPPGTHVLRIGAQTKPGVAVMNLRRLTLTPF